MTYFMAAISAMVTGGLFALGARTFGIDHNGILFAFGVMGAGIQVLLLLVWYLYFTKPRQERQVRERD